METFKFTKSLLRNLPPAEKGRQIEYRDSEVSGLRLRVGATGVKTFCVTKSVRGRFIRVAIGRFPELSVDNARIEALKTLGEIGQTKRNPNDIRREQAYSNVTLGEVLELYLKTREKRLKPATVTQYRRILTNFAGDWITRPLASITRAEVLKRHEGISEGRVWFGQDLSKLRTGVASGSPSQADLWARYLRAICRFAYDRYRDESDKRLLPEPPTQVLSTERQWNGMTRKNTRIRNRELGRWLKAVGDVRNEALYNRDDHVASICDALEMAVFTGLRRSEVFGLKWQRVNLSGGYFWIDETKNGDRLELPITETLNGILMRRNEMKFSGSDYVFPAARGGIVTDPRNVIDMITGKTGAGDHGEDEEPIIFTCHDLRRTFASIANSLDIGTYMLKRLMNHRTGKSADVTQGYIHYPVEELIKPASKIEREILLVSGSLITHASPNEDILELFNGLNDEKKKKLISLINDGL
ncbi:integrase family protein [Serratia marcescens]|uniref:DUF4102 domain-containing protein n=3 Tax=Serratia TaxID=613 RepID=A0A9X8VJE8_SERMA|nr:integrase family protein [Serratia marcescens]MBS3893606.1 integrase family protein [Serratia marcescens]TXE26732.1 tyrosine-type recombinase/integrase [Serratia ureilytica]